MNVGDADLATLQAELLSRLDRHDEPGDILASLQSIETGEQYRAWIESFDPDMAELAAQLVRKWGRRIESE
jgi:hypothetical protein